ncbi:hypothetical protein H6F87_13515 [Cyanobacteria bacterium FACHB-502]|nr:hypothetical protein [Cyanobacteria bacterium FACHB-502]
MTLFEQGIYNLVSESAIAAGISKKMSPRRIRHSGIVEALNPTNGDVRAMQKLARHQNIQTLMLHDDSRRNRQKDISDKPTAALQIACSTAECGFRIVTIERMRISASIV